MFYKVVGGNDDAALLELFDKAVVGGSFSNLGAAWTFNDPFEFKFSAVPPPSREAFEAWHRKHAPGRTPQELDNAWASFQGRDCALEYRASASDRGAPWVLRSLSGAALRFGKLSSWKVAP